MYNGSCTLQNYLSPRAYHKDLPFAFHNILILYICLFLYCVCVCLHPNTDRKLSNLFDKYENASLDEFNNCDYVNNVTDIQRNDLVVMQLNV